MSTITTAPPSEMTILRRIVDADQTVMDPAAARAILRLDFSSSDRGRMNRLAAKNRAGKLSQEENAELDNYIRVGQTLGILKSKARRSIKQPRGKNQGAK